MVEIKYEPVKTFNENGDRFVLTIDSKNGVYYYDNHKRDGFGLYAGDDETHFGEGKIVKKNFEDLFNKLNELYNENQALKNGNEYHQILKKKFDAEETELLGLYEVAMKSGHKENARMYMDIINILGEIWQHTIQGEEYE